MGPGRVILVITICFDMTLQLLAEWTVLPAHYTATHLGYRNGYVARRG